MGTGLERRSHPRACLPRVGAAMPTSACWTDVVPLPVLPLPLLLQTAMIKLMRVEEQQRAVEKQHSSTAIQRQQPQPVLPSADEQPALQR